jgi:hypothetical protein
VRRHPFLLPVLLLPLLLTAPPPPALLHEHWLTGMQRLSVTEHLQAVLLK